MAPTTSTTAVPIIDVIDPLRRYVRAHVHQQQDAEDVVQETLARVMAAQGRLALETTVAYALVVARHIMVDQAASEARRRSNAHRLIDLTQPRRPEEALLEAEESDALAQALAALPADQRQMLQAHVLDDESLVTMAADRDRGSGSVAAQLARTRARLRVDYVIALRKASLPTPRCRPVLLAVSAGDLRRQRALRAGQHLLTCSTCAEVSEPLLARRSVLAAVLPWLGLGPLIALLRSLWRNSPTQVVAGSAAVTTVGALTLVAVLHSSPASPASPAGAAERAAPAVSAPVSAPPPASASAAPPAKADLVDLADGSSLFPVPADLAVRRGDRVRARGVPVLSVDSDEGFWVGRGGQGGQGRLWVQLNDGGRESSITVRAGDRLDFTGTIVRHTPRFAADKGVTRAEGAKLLTSQGSHLKVDVKDVHRAR